jgi:hypothetical protein
MRARAPFPWEEQECVILVETEKYDHSSDIFEVNSDGLVSLVKIGACGSKELIVDEFLIDLLGRKNILAASSCWTLAVC